MGAVLAAAPIVVVLVLMVGRRWAASRAGAVGAALTPTPSGARMRIDPRSAMLNTEMGAFVRHPAVARQIGAEHDRLMEPLEDRHELVVGSRHDPHIVPDLGQHSEGMGAVKMPQPFVNGSTTDDDDR